ncbi:MAG: hypothetical protein AAF409_10790 [Pseudomonadota bacterium]
MGLEIPISREAMSLRVALHRSPVAFSYYDSADRLRFWNTAYEDVNFRVRPLIREGAYFPDLLAAVVAADQVDMGAEAQASWIEARMMQRRYGATAIRQLTDNRTFLVQERKDQLGGTLGFWLNISDLLEAGARMSPETVLAGADVPMDDHGPRVEIREHLQTLLGNLEMMQMATTDAEPGRLIDEAISAGRAIGRVVDHERRRA